MATERQLMLKLRKSLETYQTSQRHPWTDSWPNRSVHDPNSSWEKSRRLSLACRWFESVPFRKKKINKYQHQWEPPCAAYWSVSRESTSQWLSSEWLHFRISSKHSTERTTLHSIINNTTGKYCSVAFIWMVTLEDFFRRLNIYNHPVQHNKQYHWKVLLSSFHLHGHT